MTGRGGCRRYFRHVGAETAAIIGEHLRFLSNCTNS
jgi:hypothetical protein